MWPDLRKGRGLIAFPIERIWPFIVSGEYGTNLKFGHLSLITWFYFCEQFYVNRLNHTMNCNQLKLEFKKGYKTPFRKSGHKLGNHAH